MNAYGEFGIIAPLIFNPAYIIHPLVSLYLNEDFVSRKQVIFNHRSVQILFARGRQIIG